MPCSVFKTRGSSEGQEIFLLLLIRKKKKKPWRFRVWKNIIPSHTSSFSKAQEPTLSFPRNNHEAISHSNRRKNTGSACQPVEIGVQALNWKEPCWFTTAWEARHGLGSAAWVWYVTEYFHFLWLKKKDTVWNNNNLFLLNITFQVCMGLIEEDAL